MPSFSNGAVYADLDNDGDLDVVVNNINSEPIVYNNNTRQKLADSSHFYRSVLWAITKTPMALALTPTYITTALKCSTGKTLPTGDTFLR